MTRLLMNRFATVCLLLVACTAPQLARGEETSPAPAKVASADDLAKVFELGARLERERRWADALTHYEDANRHHPNQPDIVKKLTLARAHYDVCRRYSDSSFGATIDSLSQQDAIGIYDEVLLKINTHYVHQPNWQELFNRGRTSLEVALTEAQFIEKNLAKLSPQEVASLKQELQRQAGAAVINDRRRAIDTVNSVAASLQQKFGVRAQAIILEFTCGATGSLDEYSSFLSSSQMEEVFSQIEGNFVGLGVELKTEPTGLNIVNVISVGPAFEAGIRPGDRIVSVDGKTPKQITPDAMADMLRGEEGSQVRVEVTAKDGQTRSLLITRRRVEVPSVDDIKMVDEEYHIGYFKITSFQKTTPRDVDAALWKLHEKGMRSLVIDLRGNPGGLLKAAVDIADKFVMDGMIVATRGRSPREDFDHKGQVVGTWRVPLVILVDHDSASASEILAGAIQDHRRGSIVGEKSYGKGSVQGIFPLNVSTVGVRLTTAKWYTPAGQPISGNGVTPDVIVRTAARPVVNTDLAVSANTAPAAPTEDAILRAGLQISRANLSKK
ncbi:MAG: S41 family peptidase [Pirellulaceae bacterium]